MSLDTSHTTLENASDVQFQPGGAQFGNFANYYEFNKAQNRLDLLSGDLESFFCDWSQMVCLDVGCNSGDMTLALIDSLTKRNQRKVNFLAVDLDEGLIQRAVAKSASSSVHFLQLDVMDEKAMTQTCTRYLERHGKTRFDVCFCLAVTMWIHLHHGDEGLCKFLSTISSWTDHILLEAQPWKCYKNATRRMHRLGLAPFPKWSSMQMRENVSVHINNVLSECNMLPVLSFGRTCWDRPLTLYKRKTC